MNPVSVLAIACGFAFLPFASTLTSDQDPAAAPAKVNRYIGAKQCQNCHKGAAKGDPYDHWTKGPHAKAWATLATAKAKEVGAKLGIADPQTSPKCLECHVTAYGAPAAEFKPTFKMADGVQCESCHGPGEAHFKLRFAESQKGGAAAPVTEAEILVKRDAATCKKCHNDKSPSYKPFCLVERMEKIEHLDPRKTRSEEDLKKLRSTCHAECVKCATEKKDAPKDAGK